MEAKSHPIFQISLTRCLTLVAVCALIVFIGNWTLRSIRGVSRFDVSAETANALIGHRLRIPAAAEHVNLYFDSLWIEIDFRIGETDLVVWCKENNWEACPVNKEMNRVFKPARTSPEQEWMVDSGLVVDTPSGALVYDRARSRACVTQYSG